MTREEAIKVCTREKECVQSALDVCADGGHYVSPDGIITAMDYVEAMTMAIAALREQPRWIPVEERLPEKNGAYITMTNARGDSKGVVAQKYEITTVRGKEVKRWLWLGRISPWTVTHWMPLPEPPEVTHEQAIRTDYR